MSHRAGSRGPEIVLVVDDDPRFLELMEVILRQAGYGVIGCESGDRAIEILQTDEVDLVMLDYLMPGLSGEEVLFHIKSSPSTAMLPVVMVTGIKHREERLRWLDLGADDFIYKPFENKVLLSKVRTLTRLRRLGADSENFENVLSTLSSVMEARDPCTRGHSERVSKLAGLMADWMGFGITTQRLLRRAGLVHDIGKIAVDLTCIHKPGSLTPEERTVVMHHPEAGAIICAPLRSAREIIPLIRHHHEKLNGEGYPDHLVEDQIPLTVRIISVADVFDALTSHRPYRPALEQEEAIAVLRREVEMGFWDGDVVEMLASRSPQELRATLPPPHSTFPSGT